PPTHLLQSTEASRRRATSHRRPVLVVPSITTSAARPRCSRVAIALPKYGPASFFQLTAGRRTPEERARNWAAEASPAFQHSFISGRIAAGAWLWIGEQVS